MPEEQQSAGAVIGGAIVAILAVILAPLFRSLNGRDLAKDKATTEHIATLKQENAELKAELKVLRAAHEASVERCGQQAGKCDLLVLQQAAQNDAMEKLRIQHDALQADLQMTRAMLDASGIAWRK